MGIANHRVNVVSITDILKHPNADSLGLVKIEGYQCVVKLSDWKVGDFGVYIQPDSVVPEAPQYAFLWSDVAPDKEIPARKRRITVRRFRKELSEGLLLPISLFYEELEKANINVIGAGDDVANALGITHYEPEEDVVNINNGYKKSFIPKKWWSLKAWYYSVKSLFTPNPRYTGENEKPPEVKPPDYDVEALKNFIGAFTPEDRIVATEKIHGSNIRFLWDGKRMYVGSRKLWKSEKGSNVWREALAQNRWIELWCKAHTNYTLYGEVTPTQGGFNYGCAPGEVKVFIFDILTPERTWLSYEDARANTKNQLVWVPQLYVGLFDEPILKDIAEGQSFVQGANHIREGIVFKLTTEQPERVIHGLGRLQLKLVGNGYYERT